MSTVSVAAACPPRAMTTAATPVVGMASRPRTASARVRTASSRSSPAWVKPRSKVEARSGRRTTRQTITAPATSASPAPPRKPLPMFPGPYARSSNPTATTTATPRRHRPMTIAFCLGVRSVVDMEDLLDLAVEVAGDGDGQGEGRVVPAGLDRVDGLPGDPQRLGEGRLGQPGGEPQLPDVVAHPTSS